MALTPDTPPGQGSLTAAADEELLDVDLDELSREELQAEAVHAPPGDAQYAETLAADVEETSNELTFLDTTADDDDSIAALESVRAPSPAVDLEDTADAVVSYSEPAIAPSAGRAFRPGPAESLRVPDIPDLDLHVAAALEAVAQRIRAGELHLPPVDGVGDESSSLALALAALLSVRR